MRYLYSLFFTSLIPFILLRLWWRGRKLPAYRRRWAERFARFEFIPQSKTVVWLHTVSVGEFIAAKQIIEWLLQRKNLQVVVTTTTPTGSEQVSKAFGERVFHVYAPYDLPFCVVPFLKKIQPVLAIFMETELWPNTIHYCHKAGTRVLLANGRLSEKSANGYRRVALLAQPMLHKIDSAAIQHQADADRFIELGLPADRVRVTGSIKFDIAIAPEIETRATELKKHISLEGVRKIVIAASTHKGEDEIILTAWRKVLEKFTDALLVLVPRHPDRFDDVYRLCLQQGFDTARRSERAVVNGDVQVLLGDTLGELLMLYGCADIAFVGGTLVRNGGHNFLEPAAWGLPVLSGPSTFNFTEIFRLLRENNALLVVDDATSLADQTVALLENEARRTDMGKAAKAVVEDNRGALAKLKDIVETLIETPSQDG